MLSVDCFQNKLFQNILTGIPSESITLDPDQALQLSGLIWVQTICKGYQQAIKVTELAGKEIIILLQTW